MDKEKVTYIYIHMCINVYKMEYYSAMKKNGILPFATTWMDLEGIMLGEISEAEKDKYHRILLICRT